MDVAERERTMDAELFTVVTHVKAESPIADHVRQGDVVRIRMPRVHRERTVHTGNVWRSGARTRWLYYVPVLRSVP